MTWFTPIMCMIGSHNQFLFDLILYVPVNSVQACQDGFSCDEPVLSREQRVLLKDISATSEDLTRIPSISSQAIYHRATVFPHTSSKKTLNMRFFLIKTY